jgi:hypothetical protein
MALGSAYAKGKWALGECRRSGRKMLLRNMVADGYYPNLIVDPEWYEPKHPQESLPKVRDPVSLFRPAPDQDRVSATIRFRSDQSVASGYALGNVTLDAPVFVPPVLPPPVHAYDMDAIASPEPDTGTG